MKKSMLLSPRVISFLSFGHQKGRSVILTDPKYSLLILGEADTGTKIKDFFSGALFMAEDIRDLDGNNN